MGSVLLYGECVTIWEVWYGECVTIRGVCYGECVTIRGVFYMVIVLWGVCYCIGKGSVCTCAKLSWLLTPTRVSSPAFPLGHHLHPLQQLATLKRLSHKISRPPVQTSNKNIRDFYIKAALRIRIRIIRIPDPQH